MIRSRCQISFPTTLEPKSFSQSLYSDVRLFFEAIVHRSWRARQPCDALTTPRERARFTLSTTDRFFDARRLSSCYRSSHRASLLALMMRHSLSYFHELSTLMYDARMSARCHAPASSPLYIFVAGQQHAMPITDEDASRCATIILAYRSFLYDAQDAHAITSFYRPAAAFRN